MIKRIYCNLLVMGMNNQKPRTRTEAPKIQLMRNQIEPVQKTENEPLTTTSPWKALVFFMTKVMLIKHEQRMLKRPKRKEKK